MILIKSLLNAIILHNILLDNDDLLSQPVVCSGKGWNVCSFKLRLFFIAHWNNNILIDMLSHSDALPSGEKAYQFYSVLVLPDRDWNPWVEYAYY